MAAAAFWEEPDGIFRAVWQGSYGDVDDSLEGDPRRCDARGQVQLWVDNSWVTNYTPSMLAAHRDHTRILERLLEEGPDLGARDSRGWTAGHYACHRGKARALELLIAHGLSRNARTAEGVSLLDFAASGGSNPCLDVLIAGGGGGGAGGGGDALEINTPAPLYKFTSLHLGVMKPRSGVVRRLVAAGADPTARDRFGRTPLDIARAVGNRRCIALVEGSIGESQRVRALLKARALVDTAHQARQVQAGRYGNQRRAVENAEAEAAYAQPRGIWFGKRKRSSDSAEGDKRRAVVAAAAPAYLKGRAAEGRALPEVEVERAQGPSKTRTTLEAVGTYVLGLESSGGGAHVEGGGMVKEVFVELCEYMGPKWDRP